MSVAVHHAAISVADVDRSIDFYGRHFGAEVELRLGAEGEDVGRMHDLPRARLELALLCFSGGARLELLAFSDPPASEAPHPRSCDRGGMHIALQVDDVPALYERLRAQGVRFASEPTRLGDADAPSFVAAFCLDPDGYRIELLQEV